MPMKATPVKASSETPDMVLMADRAWQYNDGQNCYDIHTIFVNLMEQFLGRCWCTILKDSKLPSGPLNTGEYVSTMVLDKFRLECCLDRKCPVQYMRSFQCHSGGQSVDPKLQSSVPIPSR